MPDSNKDDILEFSSATRLFGEIRLMIALEASKGLFLDDRYSAMGYELGYICTQRGLTFIHAPAVNLREPVNDFDVLVLGADCVTSLLEEGVSFKNSHLYILPAVPARVVELLASRADAAVFKSSISFGSEMHKAHARISGLIGESDGALVLHPEAAVFDLIHRMAAFESSVELIAEQAKELEHLRDYKVNAEKKLVILRKLHLPRLLRQLFGGPR